MIVLYFIIVSTNSKVFFFFRYSCSYLLLDRDKFFTGRVFGEKSSEVKIHMDDGLITGIIHTPDETYHIEVTAEKKTNLV